VAVKYVKKRIEVEAEQWFPGREVEGVEEFYDPKPDIHLPYPVVHTPNGPVRIEPGEWIITGAANEKYPCKAHIFEATYEVAVEDMGSSRCYVCGTPAPGEANCPYCRALRERDAARNKLEAAEGALGATRMRNAFLEQGDYVKMLRRAEAAEAKVAELSRDEPEKQNALQLACNAALNEARDALQLACDVVGAMVEGNPKVTPEELPRWLASFLATSREVDAERGAVIRALTIELLAARARLGEEITVVTTVGEVLQTREIPFADVTVEEFKVDPKESVEQLDAYVTAKYGGPQGTEPGQAVAATGEVGMCKRTYFGLRCTLREGHEGDCAVEDVDLSFKPRSPT